MASMSGSEEYASDCGSDLEESYPRSVSKNITVSDVYSYLQGEGIPAAYCKAFKGQA